MRGGSSKPTENMTTLQRNRASSRWNPSGWISGAIVGLLVMSWAKRLVFVGVAVVAVWSVMSLAGHGLKGWSFHPWGSGGLPVSAAEQAPLFTQAWAAQDRAGMMRFVAPADEAKLKAWIVANPVPSSVAAIAAADRDAKTVSVEKDDTDGAIVKVRVSDGARLLVTIQKPPADILSVRYGRTLAAIGFSPLKPRHPTPPFNKRSLPMERVRGRMLP